MASVGDRKQEEEQAYWSRVVERLEDVAAASGRSLNELSQVMGGDRTALSSLFSMRKKGLKLPVLSSVKLARIASELNVPADFLLCLDDDFQIQAADSSGAAYAQHLSARLYTDIMRWTRKRMISEGANPTIEDVLSWWRSSGGRLGGGNRIEEHIDTIEVPDPNASVVMPVRVGAFSLAARTFGSNDCGLLARHVESLSSSERLALVKSYSAAHEQIGQYSITDHVANISIPEVGSGFSVEYLRLLLKVVSADGKDYVASFCVEMSSE